VKRETLFLKVVVLLMGIPVLALCLFGLPSIAKEAAEYFPTYWVYPAIIGMYGAAITYYGVLYQAFKLLSYIDKNIAFSELSVRALKTIKYYALAASALFSASLPLIFLGAQADDAPGLVLLGLAITFAPTVIAVFSAVLEKLLKDAIDIKSENDLTV
jgi:hypothetical protein